LLFWIRGNFEVFRFLSMIVIVKLIFSLGFPMLYPLEVDARSVRVRGYYRKDGTYVRSHYRTLPDGNPYNNYSYPGNYNPNIVKITPGGPRKYLDRYYNEPSSSSVSTMGFDELWKDIKK